MVADSGSEFYWSSAAGALGGRRLRNAAPLRLSMVRIFRHYVPVQLLLLLFAEAAVLFSAIYFGAELRLDPDALEKLRPIWPQGVIFAVVILTCMITLGLYTREVQRGSWSYYAKFFASFLLGWVGMTLIFYIHPPLFLGRGVMGIAFVTGLAGTALLRLVFLRVVDQQALLRRILVLGTGTRAARVGKLLRESPSRHKFQLVGYLPLSAQEHAVEGGKVLQERDSLLSVVYKHAVDEVIVGVRDRRNGGLPMTELLQCKVEGVRVTDLSSFFERETGQVQLECLNPSWIVFCDGFMHGSYKYVVKRIFDIVSSVLLLAITFPIMAFTALMIYLETGAPVFYRQERVGELGRTFNILKFRSMRHDAEGDGAPQWASQDDGRITRVGRVIRHVRIDELPQVFNVLRGEMSFVGPRPERPYFVKELVKQIPYYQSRHTVKPGITGWAQIRYGYGASVEDAVRKLQYDLYYAKNHSLFLDFVILLQTAQVVLFGNGAR